MTWKLLLMVLRGWKKKIFLYYMKEILKKEEIFPYWLPEQDSVKRVYSGMDSTIIHLRQKAVIVIFPVEVQEDLELHDFMLRKYKVVSWESIIAGPGIFSIFQFLCEVKKRNGSVAIEDKLKTSDPSAVVSRGGH